MGVEREEPELLPGSGAKNYKVSTFNEKLNVSDKPLEMHQATVTTVKNTAPKKKEVLRTSSQDFSKHHLGYNSALNDENINIVKTNSQEGSYTAKFEQNLDRIQTENSKEVI